MFLDNERAIKEHSAKWVVLIGNWMLCSDGVKAKAVVHKDKVLNRNQGLRQGHDEPTQYHFLWRKYLPVTNSVY